VNSLPAFARSQQNDLQVLGVGFGRRPYNFRSLLCLFLVSAAKWTQTLAIAANVSRAVASGNI
jgi:hypothetical protein